METSILTGLFFLALLIEGITEYFVAAPLKAKGIDTWFVRYIALAIGIGIAIAFQANLPALLHLQAQPEIIAEIATGIILSRGANYLSDLLGRLAQLMEPQLPPADG